MTMQQKIDLYKELSDERKKQQALGLCPTWMSTAGYQIFMEKYLYEASSIREQFERIARTAAKHMAQAGLENIAYKKFFELIWNGWMSCSTPILANMGTSRGCPVSCSGSDIHDSISGFYQARLETAVLTKNGFGTSAYLGNIRPRGSHISNGGKASGVLPVFKGFVQDMRDVAQGTARRGAWAGYLEIDHADFDELADYVLAHPDDANAGWNVSSEFIDRLESGDADAIRRFQKALRIKMIAGKGYFFFPDKVNGARPYSYIRNDLKVKSSNLCTEIALHSDDDHTFTCVLSSMNVAKYDEWKETDAVYWATIFLDSVAQEFIDKARNIPHLEKAVRFTEKGRALGLGQCGFHTYLQKNSIPFESLDAHMMNTKISKHIQSEAQIASKNLATMLGEPEWCRGLGCRNTHLIAIAPTKSTAVIQGGISEGINPDPAMVFTQQTTAGEIERVNPVLVEIMKDRGVFNKKTIRQIKDANGSVQDVDWLTDDEKKVFKTAFEINQESIIRLASTRQKYIDQAQSINLFFSSEEDPAWISHIHKLAFKDPHIMSLYYVYSAVTVHASKGECEACQ